MQHAELRALDVDLDQRHPAAGVRAYEVVDGDGAGRHAVGRQVVPGGVVRVDGQRDLSRLLGGRRVDRFDNGVQPPRPQHRRQPLEVARLGFDREHPARRPRPARETAGEEPHVHDGGAGLDVYLQERNI